MLLQDLGWTLLWYQAVASAIGLRHRLGLADPRHGDPTSILSGYPSKSWPSKVAALQGRFSIPDFYVDPEVLSNLSKAALRRRFTVYQRDVVAPAVASGFDWPPSKLSLPWGWLASQLTTPLDSQSFLAWWSWRCLGHIPGMASPISGVCGLSVPPSAEHLTSGCLVAAGWARGVGLSPSLTFSRPEDPDMFRLQLGLSRRLWLASFLKQPQQEDHI